MTPSADPPAVFTRSGSLPYWHTTRKTANRDAFPPDFVRFRLELFAGEFANGSAWIAMHRGYSIYKDFLADYYRVIFEGLWRRCRTVDSLPPPTSLCGWAL